MGQKLWEFGYPYTSFAGVVIGPDSIIYTVKNDSTGNNLFAIFPDGIMKFKVLLTKHHVENFIAPLIRKDGSIICSDGVQTIFAINSEGSILWEYTTGAKITNESISIDREGNLYFTTWPSKFIVLTPDGNLKWEITDESTVCTIKTNTVSFSPDGKTAYLPGCWQTVIAISIENQNVKWTFGEKSVGKSIVVDSYGNLYFEQPTSDFHEVKFVSLKPNGELNWETNFNYMDAGPDYTPAIDKYGNLYMASDTLYSVDYKGNLRWKIDLEGICDAPIICDESGNIYVTTTSHYAEIFTKIYSINYNGHINWTYHEEGSFGTAGSSAIGFNNTLICPIIYNGKILTIH